MIRNAEKLQKTNENGKPNGLRLRLATLQERIVSAPRSYLAFCAIVPVVIMYLVYLAMEIHPFGNGSVLVLDMNGQYVYYHEALRSALYGEGSFLYSFSRTLGGEFMGMYAYYLASPLSLLVALFPRHRILEALLTIILIKVGLCGFTFGFYLHQNTARPNRVITVTFSTMYALCAYAVVYQNNLMWIDALIWLPILVYSIEQLIKNRRYKLFVISLSMSLISNYYIGYMMCIFTALYFFYYFLAFPREKTNPHHEKLHTARSLFRIALFSLIAIAISAFMIVAAYYSLTFGKSDFTDPNWHFRAKFHVLDLFTKFLPGSYDSVKPDGLPYVYCGLLTVILIPVYFLSKRIATREKLASLALIAVFIFSFIASPLDLIWHGFQNPNWLNYRYSFMLSFILLVLAYRAFGNLREHSAKFLLGISAFLILFAAVCDKMEFPSYLETEGKLLELETVWLTILTTVTIFVLLCLLLRQKNVRKRDNLAGILAAVVCIELFCSSLTCAVQLDGEVLYSSYSGYNNFIGDIRPVVEQVQQQDDGFYRMEKLKHRKYNDNLALSMRGLSGSTSTLHADAIQFLNSMGYTSRAHLSQYRGGTPVNDSLLGIKYLIDAKDSDKLTHYYTETISHEKYTAYQNPYAMSVAYGVDKSVQDYFAEEYNTYFHRLNGLVGAMLGEDRPKELFVPVTDYDTVLSGSCSESSTGSRIIYTPAAGEIASSVTLCYTAPHSREYYFYTPTPAPTETTLYIYNNEKQDFEKFGEYLGKDSNHIVSLGWFNAGESIQIKLELNEDPLSVYKYYDYLWSLDKEVFEDAFSALQSNPQFIVTDHTEDWLYGSIETKQESQMILTTIPYDEGWKIYVDGAEQTPYKTLDALIAFDIEAAGNHTLELKYAPPIYDVGIVISIVGLTVFLLLCAADTLIYIIRKKRGTEAYTVLGSKWSLPDFDEDDDEMKALPPETKKKKKTFSEQWNSIKKFLKNKKFKSEISETSSEPNEGNDNEGEI